MTSSSTCVTCSTAVKNILCEALRNYALFSDEIKSQPQPGRIKQLILKLADSIEYEFLQNQRQITIDLSNYSYCQRAINYHYDRITHLLNVNVTEQRKLMLMLLQGMPATDHELDVALSKDYVL